jgi:hypothetical protein
MTELHLSSIRFSRALTRKSSRRLPWPPATREWCGARWAANVRAIMSPRIELAERIEQAQIIGDSPRTQHFRQSDTQRYNAQPCVHSAGRI